MNIGSFTVADVDRLTALWKTVPWRLLPERDLTPALNVALDEVLTERIARLQSPPTLRFWRWSSPAGIIGRCQSIANEVDLAAAANLGIGIVRRMTGGGAMFVQPHGAITYSLILPEALLEGLSLRQSYEVCDAWVVAGLRELGIDCHYVPINDIACVAGKIGGAAQARRRGVVLHHTTLAYAMESSEMLSVLRLGREKLKDKGVASAAKVVAPLNLQTDTAREQISKQLQNAFQVRYGGTVGELTPDELNEAEALVDAKYGNPEWSYEFE